NQLLEEMVDTTNEWILTRTGIRERRMLKGERGPSDMGAKALTELCEKRGISPTEIDLIICATVTPDMQFPATANLIGHKAGATNAFGYDLNAACSGFLYGLVTGSKFIESGTYEKVAIIGSDKMSSIVDYTDRSTCVIFGDGCGAVLLEADHEGNGIIDSVLKSDGSGAEHLHQKAGGSLKPASHETVDAREHYIYQQGQQVFKVAVTNMADVSAEIMERNQLKSDEVAWLVPHQANLRIIAATADRIGLPKEKVMINIDHFGNTTNGTIPLCLWEYEKQLRKGDKLVLSAFGGGFTWGALYLRWAYDS
ncbi:MAG: beta-ketoacyl-ACP synthase III, partial [Bacteroidota bacterium]